VEVRSDRHVTVAWVYDAGELALLLSLFEWAGIPVVALGHDHTTVQWNIVVALGGVRLRVREQDAPAALALLASLERTPQKSARFFARDKMVDVLLVLLIFFLGGLAVPARIQADFAVARRERST
jgi:hypothetical protein